MCYEKRTFPSAIDTGRGNVEDWIVLVYNFKESGFTQVFGWTFSQTNRYLL
jgi:hypothetical protein